MTGLSANQTMEDLRSRLQAVLDHQGWGLSADRVSDSTVRDLYGLLIQTQKAGQQVLSIDALGEEDKERFYNQLLVPETYFFRHFEQFEFLRDEILSPKSNASSAQISVWCAGCATGEEAYSISMLGHLVEGGSHLNVLATDISRAYLARAEAGRYAAWSLRGMHKIPEAMRYVRLISRSTYEVAPELRKSITFKHVNIARPDLAEQVPESFDIIFFRNVLIYMKASVAAQVIGRLGQRLKDGGWLVLGPSDTFDVKSGNLKRFVHPKGVFWRRENPGTDVGTCVENRSPGSFSPPVAEVSQQKPKSTHQDTGSISLNKRTFSNPSNANGDQLRPGKADETVQNRKKENTGPKPEYFRDAVRCWEVGDIAAAKEHLRKARYTEPSNPEYLFLEGMLYVALGDTSRAARVFRKVQECAKQNPYEGHAGETLYLASSHDEIVQMARGYSERLSTGREEE